MLIFPLNFLNVSMRNSAEMPFLYRPHHKYPIDKLTLYNISCSVEYNMTLCVLSLIESLLCVRDSDGYIIYVSYFILKH